MKDTLQPLVSEQGRAMRRKTDCIFYRAGYILQNLRSPGGQKGWDSHPPSTMDSRVELLFLVVERKNRRDRE